MTPDEPPLLPGPPTVPLLAGPRDKRRMWLVAGGLLLAVLISFAAGWWVHHRREHAAEEANVKERDSIPTVSVMAVRASSPVNQLLLPGTITPIAEAALYARAAGYVLRRHVDIGDRVTKGQVLAEIESPEIDQQVDLHARRSPRRVSNLDKPKPRWSMRAPSSTSRASACSATGRCSSKIPLRART